MVIAFYVKIPSRIFISELSMKRNFASAFIVAKRTLNDIKALFVATCNEALNPHPYKIIKKDTDSLTKKATFFLKAKKALMPIETSTEDLINNERYFFGLKETERKQVRDQYLLELATPRACIIEYPLLENKYNERIFKILCMEDKNIICNTATKILKDKELVAKLKSEDVVRLAMAAYAEKYANHEELFTKPVRNITSIKSVK